MVWNWLKRRPAPTRRFVLYTRHGCHLCTDAEQLLRSVQARHAFTLEIVDVDADPVLAAQYGLEVPVVTVDGKVRFRGRVNAVLLERLLGKPGRRVE